MKLDRASLLILGEGVGISGCRGAEASLGLELETLTADRLKCYQQRQ